MEKTWIALDLDDVVLDFVRGVLDTINRDFDADIKPEDIKSWEFGQYIDHIIGRPWYDWLKDHSWLWGEKFKPVPGAIGGIEKLRAQGHHLEIVTAKPEWAEDATWLWLAKYKPRVHRLTIVPVQHISNKHELTDAEVLVDDKWENCVGWADSGRPAILYDRPHNAEYGDPPSGVTRARNWHDVLAILDLPYLNWPDEGDVNAWRERDDTSRRDGW